MCKTCIALAAPAAKTSLPTCSPCDDTRASLSSAKNATTSLNAVELPCTVDLISLVEVLGTPRENVAVVTVLDNADPNSGTTWLESGERPNCLQVMFTDTRYGMRQFVDDVRAMHIANHSTNYAMLPSHVSVLPGAFTHYCVCGDERCIGSKWRKKQVLVRRRQMMRQSSAAAVRDDAAQPAPPNVCMLTYRDVPFEKLMYEYGRHNAPLADAHAAQEQRAEKYSALAERCRHEWLPHDYTTTLPLLPLKDDLDPHLREGSETEHECDRRINATYAAYPKWHASGDAEIDALKMDHSVESQKHSSLLTAQQYDVDAVKFLHRKSVHCRPLCYNTLRPTIMRLVRLNRSVGSLIEKATVVPERFFGKRSSRFLDGLNEDEERTAELNACTPPVSRAASETSDSDDYCDDDDEDDDHDTCDDNEVSDAARTKMRFGMENGSFVLENTGDAHPLAKLSDSELLTYLDARFAKARAACVHAPDCYCLSDDFFESAVTGAFSLRMVPMSTTSLFAHLGDSIFTAESPTMRDYAALSSYAALRYSDGTFAYLKAMQNPDLSLTRNVVYKIVMSGLAAEVRDFRFTPSMLSTDRVYERLMQRQLGGFSMCRSKSGAFEMVARSDLHTQPSYAYQAMRGAILMRHSRPGDKRKKPFGDVYGHRMMGTYEDVLALAARYHPDIAHKCRGLSDYVYHTHWHSNARNALEISDWLPPYAYTLVCNAFNVGAQTTYAFDVWAARAHAEQRSLLCEEDERRVFGEMSLTDNMRLVVARLISIFCNNLTSLENYANAMKVAVVVVGVVKFCNNIVERRRHEAVQALTSPVTTNSITTTANDDSRDEASIERRRRQVKESKRKAVKLLKEARKKEAEEATARRVAEAAERARIAAERAERERAAADEAERERVAAADSEARERKQERRAEKARVRYQRRIERLAGERQQAIEQEQQQQQAAAAQELLECVEQRHIEEIVTQARLDAERRAADVRRRINNADEARAAISVQREFSPTAPEFKPQFTAPAVASGQRQQSLAQWFLQHTNVDLFSNALMVV